MNNLSKRILGIISGFILVVSGSLSGAGGVGLVKAVDNGSYVIVYNRGSANINNANLEFTFKDSSGNTIQPSLPGANLISISDSVSGGESSGNLPSDIAKVNIKVHTAGCPLTDNSYVKISGFPVQITDEMTGNSGQDFDITCDQSLDVNLTLAPNNGGGNNGQGNFDGQERNVTLNIASSCQFLLAKNDFRISFSSGDDQTQYFHEHTSGTSISGVYPANRDKVYLGITVTDQYFIPYMRALVHYEDGSTREESDGTADMGNRYLAVDIPIEPGTGDISIDLYLEVDKEVNASVSSSSVNGGSIRYNVCDSDGYTNIPDSSNVTLSIADTTKDASAVTAYGSDIDGTFDLGMSLNGSGLTLLNEPVEVCMKLNTDTYQGTGYQVVRNHNGRLEEVMTEYDYRSGTLTFFTDRFSSYSLIRTAGSPQTADDAGNNVSKEFENIFEGNDNLADGLVIGDGALTGGSKPVITTTVNSQGEKFYEAAKLVTPSGFAEAFCFNILVDGKATYDEKSGNIRIKIPSFYKKSGRTFALIAVDKNGQPYLFTDLDTSDDYLTVHIDVEGYAFQVIYMD